MGLLSWVDYDESYEKAARDSVAALNERDARNELGLGGVRDTFSDLFFPGTSTVQRRLKYFLFVPWCCEAAQRDARGRPIGQELRNKEARLIEVLRPLGEQAGVIGLRRGAELVIMPSAIYWSGLRTLDILKIPGSPARWARFAAEDRQISDREAPPEDARAAPGLPGFDAALPSRPVGFPAIEGIDFSLSPTERHYLRQRITTATTAPSWGLEHNLFDAFRGPKVPNNVAFAWEHPRANRLTPQTSHLLGIAAAFSKVMYGAVLLYNYLLCLERHREGAAEAANYADRYRGELKQWASEVQASELDILGPGLREILPIASRLRHSIDTSTVVFADRWIQYARDPHRLPANGRAHELIIAREKALKGSLGTSRFLNAAARERWGYQSGGRLDYRWPVVRSYLNDLAG